MTERKKSRLNFGQGTGMRPLRLGWVSRRGNVEKGKIFECGEGERRRNQRKWKRKKGVTAPRSNRSNRKSAGEWWRKKTIDVDRPRREKGTSAGTLFSEKKT